MAFWGEKRLCTPPPFTFTHENRRKWSAYFQLPARQATILVMLVMNDRSINARVNSGLLTPSGCDVIWKHRACPCIQPCNIHLYGCNKGFWYDIPEIMRFQVTIATNCRTWTRYMNGSYVVADEWVPVNRVYSANIDFTCRVHLIFIMGCVWSFFMALIFKKCTYIMFM